MLPRYVAPSASLTRTHGCFRGTDASIFITLHDEDGLSSDEWDLNAGLYEHAEADADLPGPSFARAKLASTSQTDKTFTFESGKTDYFFLEDYATDRFGLDPRDDRGTARPPLGELSHITLRVEASGAASLKWSRDATMTVRLKKENMFDGWDCEWVGVTRLAINGAGGETKQYSFPCKGTPAAEDFYKPGSRYPDSVKLPVDKTPGDPTRPVTEDDESVVAVCQKVLPTLRTGDVVLFLSASWTAPHVTAVTGQPYSHAGLLVVDETTVPGQRIVLDYEATNNKSGTPDIMAGYFSRQAEDGKIEKEHVFPYW